MRDCGSNTLTGLHFNCFSTSGLWDYGKNSFTRLTLIIIQLVYHVHFDFNKLGNSFRGYKITAIFTIYRGVTTALCFCTSTQTLWLRAAFQYFETNDSLWYAQWIQRFSGLRAGGLNAVRPFFSFFFFPPAWNVLQLSTRFVRLSFWKEKNSECFVNPMKIYKTILRKVVYSIPTEGDGGVLSSKRFLPG